MIYAIVVLIVLILDQAVKYWVNATLDVGAVSEFIPKLVELTRHFNPGMAFGLLGDKPWARWVFVALTIVFCGVIIYMLASNLIKEKLGRWLIVLTMAGGIGNCIDRAINGYVVDMFHFQFPIFGKDFPIFNIADIFITVGGIAFCAWLIFHKQPEEERVPAQRPPRTRARSAPERREAPESRDDYITQLKKPVATARVDLEQERERAKRLAEERERERQARSHPRTRPQPQAQPNPGDPFAEFSGSPAPAAPKAAPPPRREAPPASAPRPAAPAPRKEPAADPAPKKSDMDFTLDDILEEFSDK